MSGSLTSIIPTFTKVVCDSDDESKVNISPTKLKGLGEIEVRLTLVQRLGSRTELDRALFTPNLDGSIPEKCLKGQAISQKVA